MNQIKDPELKSIIQKHYAAHVQDYNIKVEYLSKTNGPMMKLQVPELSNTIEVWQWMVKIGYYPLEAEKHL